MVQAQLQALLSQPQRVQRVQRLHRQRQLQQRPVPQQLQQQPHQ